MDNLSQWVFLLVYLHTRRNGLVSEESNRPPPINLSHELRHWVNLHILNTTRLMFLLSCYQICLLQKWKEEPDFLLYKTCWHTSSYLWMETLTLFTKIKHHSRGLTSGSSILSGVITKQCISKRITLHVGVWITIKQMQQKTANFVLTWRLYKLAKVCQPQRRFGSGGQLKMVEV